LAYLYLRLAEFSGAKREDSRSLESKRAIEAAPPQEGCDHRVATTAWLNGFEVSSPGDLTLPAGEVVHLSYGFSVSGDRLAVEIDPNLKP